MRKDTVSDTGEHTSLKVFHTYISNKRCIYFFKSLTKAFLRPRPVAKSKAISARFSYNDFHRLILFLTMVSWQG